MRKLICIPLLLLSFCLWAEDNPDGPLPYNAHEFNWEGISKDGIKFSGHGVAYNAGKAFVFAFKELDRLTVDGYIKNGTTFEITIVWKEKSLVSHYIARSEYPVLLPRGPDKEKELPRGPSKEKERPRGKD